MLNEQEQKLLLEEVAKLREENERLKRTRNLGMNPVYMEMIQHLTEKPRTIPELVELMFRDNRTISQYLHQLKSKFGAEIITLSDGKKKLTNPELFYKSRDIGA